MFVTAVFAVLDQNSGELTYANAGHCPPLWVRQDSLERFDAHRRGARRSENAHMQEKTITIQDGESLMLYTDGVTETFNLEGDMFGEERILRAIGWQETGSADDMIKAIETALDDFAGNAATI